MIKFTGNAGDFVKIGLANAGRGDIESVREILKARPKWLNRPGPHGRTLIWEASHRGKLPMVKYLVRRKANVNSCGTYYTPYFVEVSCYCIARFKRRHDVADYLLEKGADIDIHTAAYLGDVESVKGFLKKKRSLVNSGHPQHDMGNNLPDGNDYFSSPAPWATPLCYALQGGNLETVELLIRRGSKIKGRERQLFIAADADCEKLRLLLENGADPKMLPPIMPDETELVELAKRFGIKPAKADSEALIYLCRGDRGGNPEEVSRMIAHGAKVNFRDHKGKTAAHRAAKAGFVKTIQVLLDHEADLNIADKKGETPLFEVIRSTIKDMSKKCQTLKLLLNNGANPNHCNTKGQTALDVAQAIKNPDAKKLATILERC